MEKASDKDLIVRSPKQGEKAMRHPAVRKQHREALKRRRRHKKAVLVPCSTVKPYTDSPSHKHGYTPALEGKDVDVWVVSEPMGIIPIEWADQYPNTVYDFPPKHVKGKAREMLVKRLREWLEVQGPKYDRLYLALPQHHFHLIRDAAEGLDLPFIDASISHCRAKGACSPRAFRATSGGYRNYLRKRVRNPENMEENPLGNLPAKASRMWELVYESAQDRGFSEGDSAAQAWCAVKRRYRKKGGRWLKRKRPLKPHESPPGCTHRRAANPYEPTGFFYDGVSDDPMGLTIEEAALIDCAWTSAIVADCEQREGCTPDKVRVRLSNPEPVWIEPPEMARIIAGDVLALRKTLPKSRKAMTATGLQMARDIRDGKLVDARKIWAWFRRHEGYILDAEAQGKDARTSKAIQAGMGWGYWPMYEAAQEAVGRADNPMSRVGDEMLATELFDAGLGEAAEYLANPEDVRAIKRRVLR